MGRVRISIGGVNLFNVALCCLPESKDIICGKIATFMSASATDYTVTEFSSVADLIESGDIVDVCFLNNSMREDQDLLIKHIERLGGDNESDSKKFRFLAYCNDPVSESDCEVVIDSMRRYLGLDSMHFALELSTDKGLRSFAVAKILFFECRDRKIRIKTRSDEYLYKDSMRRVMSLVSNHGFCQPHKSFIINMKHIASIKNYMITMNDKSLIPLSQKRSKEFRKAYKAYLENHDARISGKPN